MEKSCIVDSVKQLREEFFDLQAVIYLDKLHEAYSDRMSLRISDDGFGAVLQLVQGGIEDRIENIDILIRQLYKFLGLDIDQ